MEITAKSALRWSLHKSLHSDNKEVCYLMSQANQRVMKYYFFGGKDYSPIILISENLCILLAPPTSN